ncbi:MAG TPA: hypothetical protein VF786_15325 [Terriglobales bacterium]
MKRALTITIVLAASLSGSAAAQGTEKQSSWEALKHVSHDATFAYRLNGKNSCLYGHIQHVSDNSLTIVTDKRAKIVIPRADIERVYDGLEPNDFIFTIYNSWADVKALDASMNRKEFVRVVDARGAKHEGRVVKVSDSDITVKTANDEITVARKDVAWVEYIRLKPVSDNAQQEGHHGVYVRPELWPYAMGIGPKMTVRVYDSSQPETAQPPGNCSWHD